MPKILCRYEWNKDGRPLGSVSNIVFAGNGTLHISYLTPVNEGIYQCFAGNDYGRTMSTFAELRRAVRDGSPENREEIYRNEGQSLRIDCRQTIKSFPAPHFSWELKDDRHTSPVQMDHRRQIDQHGNYC